ncbi:MAG: hypothetical protein AAF152_18640 [Cyanobacteria bacterium P01_A01_bin.114]
MEDWLTQLENTVNTAADEAGQWFTETLGSMYEASEQAVSEFEKTVDQTFDDLEQTLDQTFEPWATSVTSSFISWVETATMPLTQVVEPWLQEHPRCIGCRNYHGQSYGSDAALICAIHPYGPDPDLERCPDWESVWQG